MHLSGFLFSEEFREFRVDSHGCLLDSPRRLCVMREDSCGLERFINAKFLPILYFSGGRRLLFFCHDDPLCHLPRKVRETVFLELDSYTFFSHSLFFWEGDTKVSTFLKHAVQKSRNLPVTFAEK